MATPNNLLNDLKNYDLKQWIYTILIAVAVCCIGLICLNQYMAFRYSAVWLSTPCDLCAELNPEIEDCVRTKVKTNSVINYTEQQEILQDFLKDHDQDP